MFYKAFINYSPSPDVMNDMLLIPKSIALLSVNTVMADKAGTRFMVQYELFSEAFVMDQCVTLVRVHYDPYAVHGLDSKSFICSFDYYLERKKDRCS